MSYILDALKRAEQQRGGAARAGVRVPRNLPLEAAARGPWPWIAATAVGVAAIVGIVTLWPATAPLPTTTTTAPLPSSTPPPGGAATTGNRPAAAPAPSRPSGASPSRGVAPSTPPARGVQPAMRAAESRPVPPPATRAPSPAPTERGTTARVARPRPVDHDPDEMAPSPVAPELERAEARPAPQRRPAPEGRPAPEPVPAAGGEAKALAAKISLQVLSWAPEPRDRFVFLNGRRYAEGQLIDDKLRVERIMEDGVVLSYRGEQVTLKGR
jgi:general secretion pathway protein B